jgi:hypothetical protein
MDYVNSAAEGIDTISFQVNEAYIDKQLWGKNHYFEPFITLSQYGGMKRFFTVNVQSEALNKFGNYRSQIILLIVRLHYRGIIQLPIIAGQYYQYNRYEYVDKNLGYIAKLTALDFFFDFMRKDIQKYEFPDNYPTTNYSMDHKRSKPLWIIYDRSVNLKRQRHIPYAVIDAMPYPMRVELRLNRQSCKYLNFVNINGSYYDISYCFYNYIARSWRAYRHLIGMPSKTNYHYVFNEVLYAAEQEHIPMVNLQPSDTLF